MPPCPRVKSIIASSPTAVATAAHLVRYSLPAWTLRRLLTSSTVLLIRSFTIFRPSSLNTMVAATALPAFATATNNGSSSAKSGNLLSRFAGNFGRSSSRFSSSSRKRTISISSVPSMVLPRESVISSSASSTSSLQSPEDSIHQNSSSQPSTLSRQYSTTPKASSSSVGGSKLSSSRSQAAIKLLPSYLIDARAITQYSPSTPEGALQLSVAENQLAELPVEGLVGIMENSQADEVISSAGKKEMKLVDVLSQLASSNAARPFDESGAMNVFERDMIYYQPTQGVPSLRTAMGNYLHSLLLSPTHPSMSSTFNPENIVLGAGCNAVLENLCMCLANPGDAVLIPTPYYAAFEFDLAARAECHIVPVNTFNHQNDDREVPSCKMPIAPEFYYPNKSSLDAAYQRAMDETGRAPRVLLLSHPNNPLGICYPPHVVEECIDWCREKEVHLISDEIYAGSVHRKERVEGESKGQPTFVSAMALGGSSDTTTSAGLGLGPYIHLVYALSKDFALSGLRVGVAYTENEEILMPLQKLNDLCQISSQTQLLVERMMCANAVMEGNDDTSQKFVDVYLKANQDNVRARCDELHSCLDDLGIPYLRADSGLFVWMDFREFLPNLPAGVTEAMESIESKEKRERKLYLSLMKEYGLLFTPGMSMRNERAGFFRCVFTAASDEEFELGLVRLRKFVEEMRK